METQSHHRINAWLAPSRYVLARQYLIKKNITISKLTGCLLEILADAMESGNTAEADNLIKKIGAEK